MNANEAERLLAELAATFEVPAYDPEHEITAMRYAEAAHIDRQTARRRLDSMVNAGRASKRRVQVGRQVAEAYRLNE